MSEPAGVSAVHFHRRPLQFSLRVVLAAVTASCFLLGYGAYYARWAIERNSGLKWLEQHGVGGGIGFVREQRPSLPLGLRLLGQESLDWRAVAPLSDEMADYASYKLQVDKMVKLFPECQLVDLGATVWPSAAELEQEDRYQKEYWEKAIERYRVQRLGIKPAD